MGGSYDRGGVLLMVVEAGSLSSLMNATALVKVGEDEQTETEVVVLDVVVTLGSCRVAPVFSYEDMTIDLGKRA